jgi:hypothetical protein
MKYTIEAGTSPNPRDLDENGVNDVQHADTLADAKAKAKRMLSEQYARENEMSERQRYARVTATGSNEVLLDFFS